MNTTLFMIAGEPSGDTLGATLMQGLKEQNITDIRGIGGEHMQQEGLETLIPMDELSVMGIWEIVGQLPRLLKLINATVEDIERIQPDIVITIDFPDFNFQVAQRLKKRGNFTGKIIHYGAPTVWAWRPERAKKVAAYLDGMMCLYPFEPPYFEKHGLRAEYVGHPITQIVTNAADGASFRKTRGIAEDAYCVGLFFGSREAEINACASVFLETVDALYEQNPKLELIVPTLPNLEYDISKKLEEYNIPYHMVVKDDAKWHAFDACDIAIAVSGTVGLELAYMDVPHIIGYKTNPVTATIAKQLIKLKHIHLANILLKREIVPEFLQGQCNASKITREILSLIAHPKEIDKQKAGFAEMREFLKLEKQNASCRATNFVLNVSMQETPNEDAA